MLAGPVSPGSTGPPTLRQTAVGLNCWLQVGFWLFLNQLHSAHFELQPAGWWLSPALTRVRGIKFQKCLVVVRQGTSMVADRAASTKARCHAHQGGARALPMLRWQFCERCIYPGGAVNTRPRYTHVVRTGTGVRMPDRAYCCMRMNFRGLNPGHAHR